MLACPFAKGNPTKQIQCLIIGRQNLSGAKEHIKRNHFNKLLPQDIRRAKKWSDVFDICNPQWPPRPHPSPSDVDDFDQSSCSRGCSGAMAANAIFDPRPTGYDCNRHFIEVLGLRFKLHQYWE
ncbi:uncharacterized protein DFL_000617 [Arthrobotrys flagrans]|uniref:Uncharacterized protein n=1 Tax=Arthrobotrys flagrans TaxID=97331 RepID=A0A437AER9_ARTFL|nr:hypothetical protein DFL_000617 [Arthrobotrys flagrans]